MRSALQASVSVELVMFAVQVSTHWAAITDADRMRATAVIAKVSTAQETLRRLMLPTSQRPSPGSGVSAIVYRRARP